MYLFNIIATTAKLFVCMYVLTKSSGLLYRSSLWAKMASHKFGNTLMNGWPLGREYCNFSIFDSFFPVGNSQFLRSISLFFLKSLFCASLQFFKWHYVYQKLLLVQLLGTYYFIFSAILVLNVLLKFHTID